MKTSVKSFLSKINFALNRNPRIAGCGNAVGSWLIPQPYRSVLLLCADFELAWAWRYAKGIESPKIEALNLARVARRNIPRILDLCDAYDIPITWATVGHLFLKKCDRKGRIPHGRIKRIPYHENRYWKFSAGEWYDDDPCATCESAPEWYAPDMVKKIIKSGVGHEMACHTFSHIDCSDSVCTPDVLESEISECKRQAKKYGVVMTSFVHPGHTIGNLQTLRSLGFTSYRTDNQNTLGLPIKHSSGLWELKTSAEIYHRVEWSYKYHLYRLQTIIDRGIKFKRVIYIRFHPSFSEVVVPNILRPLFSYIAGLMRKGTILVTTAGKYVDYLNHCDERLGHE